MSCSLWCPQTVVKHKNGQEYTVTEVMREQECFWNLLRIWGWDTLETLGLHLETYFLHMNETGEKKFLSNPKQSLWCGGGWRRACLSLVGGSEADLAQIWDPKGCSWAWCQCLPPDPGGPFVAGIHLPKCLASLLVFQLIILKFWLPSGSTSFPPFPLGITCTTRGF